MHDTHRSEGLGLRLIQHPVCAPQDAANMLTLGTDYLAVRGYLLCSISC